MRGISKSFTGVRALDDVDLVVRKGEVAALVGENGAGKSTLMKVLSGAYANEQGTIRIFGADVSKASPREMLERGVAVIYQEFSLAPHLSVAENVFLGRLPVRRGRVLWRRLDQDTRRLLGDLGLSIDPRARVADLGVAQRQMVEIAKALSRDARILVLDEPSAVLGDSDLDGLFQLLRQLADRGVALVYISHRLSEVFRLADVVYVLRDGKLVGHEATVELGTRDLVRMMVGRELTELYPARAKNRGEAVLVARDLSRAGFLDGIDVTVHRGEIVGIAGLAGSGRSELLRAIAGVDQIDRGEIAVKGRPITLRSPRRLLRRGVGLLPEDRKSQGLFANQSVLFNITIARLKPMTEGLVLRRGKERSRAGKYVDTLRIRTPDLGTRIRALSGGNQQKCVLARLLSAECELLLVDEPTRGVDIGAKREIYELLRGLTRDGVAILMVSSELPEILGLSDRILVMCDGRITGELGPEQATEELIMQHATGQGRIAPKEA